MEELSSSMDWYISQKTDSSELLTAEEEIALARKIRAGSEKAKKTLIESNLRLVVDLAKRYQNCGVPLSDLVQEGNIGLIKAAEKFDDRKRCRFSTYATYWIRQKIQRAVRQQGRVVGFSENTFKQLLAFDKISDDLSQHFGRTPTVSELASEMGLSEKRVERLAQYRANLADILSLDQVYTWEIKPSCLLDDLEDPRSFDPCVTVINKDNIERIIKAFFAVLTPREQFIIEKHFGFNNDVPKDLQCLGRMLKITRERVRQLEKKAFEKIRHKVIDY